MARIFSRMGPAEVVGGSRGALPLDSPAVGPFSHEKPQGAARSTVAERPSLLGFAHSGRRGGYAPVEPPLTMHPDAADVGYGEALKLLEEAAGSSGLCAGQGFWAAEDRDDSSTLRELRAVRLLFYRHFAQYVSRPAVTKVLVRG